MSPLTLAIVKAVAIFVILFGGAYLLIRLLGWIIGKVLLLTRAPEGPGGYEIIRYADYELPHAVHGVPEDQALAPSESRGVSSLTLVSGASSLETTRRSPLSEE